MRHAARAASPALRSNAQHGASVSAAASPLPLPWHAPGVKPLASAATRSRSRICSALSGSALTWLTCSAAGCIGNGCTAGAPASSGGCAGACHVSTRARAPPAASGTRLQREGEALRGRAGRRHRHGRHVSGVGGLAARRELQRRRSLARVTRQQGDAVGDGATRKARSERRAPLQRSPLPRQAPRAPPPPERGTAQQARALARRARRA